jgi:hypothetical protein
VNKLLRDSWISLWECPVRPSSVLRPTSSVRPNTHSHSHYSLTFTQLEAATTTTIIFIHTPQPPPPPSHSQTKLRCHVMLWCHAMLNMLRFEYSKHKIFDIAYVSNVFYYIIRNVCGVILRFEYSKDMFETQHNIAANCIITQRSACWNWHLLKESLFNSRFLMIY